MKINVDIYTDGSCNTMHRVGGWASVILYGDKKVVLQGMSLNTTNQRMELTAVIESLDYLIKNHLIESIITIYSDSQYVVNLNQRKEKLNSTNFLTRKNEPVRNVDLIRRIIDYAGRLNVNFIKVKAHQKIGEELNINLEVDKLARQVVRHQMSLMV